MSINGSAGAALRTSMKGGAVVAVGAFLPIVARMAEVQGYQALYFSGAAHAHMNGVPDEGLFSRSEVLQDARKIIAATNLPVIVDVDTGFGGPKGTAQTVRLFERAGAAAIQIEDQDPYYKRCGHLPGKRLISPHRMVEKICAAVAAKTDPNFMIVARTDARAVEGLDGAIARAIAYMRAGADVVFPEALESEREFRDFRYAISVPLLANMTEYGKTPYLTVKQFNEMQYNIVIFPVTALRVALRALSSALCLLSHYGTQKPLIDSGNIMERETVNRFLRSR